jgi:hypothetical protein
MTWTAGRGVLAAAGFGLLLMSGGCGRNDVAPPAPSATRAWTRLWPDQAIRQVRFEYPGNWPVTVDRRHGGSVTVKASDNEWWRLAYHPEFLKTPVDDVADQLSRRRQRARTDLLPLPRETIEHNDHSGRRSPWTTTAGDRFGACLVFDDGWVVEYEGRERYRTLVENAFQALTNSVDITENR